MACSQNKKCIISIDFLICSWNRSAFNVYYTASQLPSPLASWIPWCHGRGDSDRIDHHLHSPNGYGWLEYLHDQPRLQKVRLGKHTHHGACCHVLRAAACAAAALGLCAAGIMHLDWEIREPHGHSNGNKIYKWEIFNCHIWWTGAQGWGKPDFDWLEVYEGFTYIFLYDHRNGMMTPLIFLTGVDQWSWFW